MTPACDLLGIELPIILAPMKGAVGPELAAAVSNAGGLGLLPLWGESIDIVRSSIRKTRSLTSAPFGVNLNLAFPQEELLEACIEEEVPIISFFWGDPSGLIGKAKEAGATVMHTVGDAQAAELAVGLGVDVVVAQGWEAGGHVRGMVATMPLVPSVVDRVGDTPVVAAGGIGDGRGLTAAMALGAGAGWIGTRFLLSEEATIHPHYRQRIVEASENGTLEEAFGTGTAVGIAYIQDIGLENETIHVSDESPVGLEVNDTLNAIKTGQLEDKFGWMLKTRKQLA